MAYQGKDVGFDVEPLHLRVAHRVQRHVCVCGEVVAQPRPLAVARGIVRVVAVEAGPLAEVVAEVEAAVAVRCVLVVYELDAL